MDFANAHAENIATNMAMGAVNRDRLEQQFYPNKEQLNTLGQFQGALYGVKELTEKLGLTSKTIAVRNKTIKVLKITEKTINEKGEEVENSYWNIDIQTEGNPQFTRYTLPTEVNSNMLWRYQQINRIEQRDEFDRVVVSGLDVVKSTEFGFVNRRDGKRVYTCFSPTGEKFLGREDAITIFEEDKYDLARVYMQLQSEIPTPE